MSGIEIAGLVFGVLPILVESVKAYSTVTDGLHTFRHYSREVKSVALQLKVHNGIFLNHCRLLLRLVEDEKDIELMLDDKEDMQSLVAVGGVMSNAYLQGELAAYCRRRHVRLLLAPAGFSADNGSGAAFWVAWQERKSK